MRIIKCKDYDDMSRKAANLLSAQVTVKSDSVLGLATGTTPIGCYQELIRRYQDGDLDFAAVKSINLDEYRGLTGDHVQSYRYFMNNQLFNHVNIDKANTFVPDGMCKDAEAECREYDQRIQELGIDMQLLGLGHNGHIGFNEPDKVFEKETHCVDLAASTIEANSRLFAEGEEVPKQAYTMGIGGIMQAKKILVLVSGEAKADILKAVCTGPITPEVPASILQLHNDVTIIADEAAASKLNL